MIDPARLIAEVLRDQTDDTGLPVTRIAIVTAVVSDGVNVRFDGETVASSRTYMRLDSYWPMVGDKVMMVRVGSTYVASGVIRAWGRQYQSSNALTNGWSGTVYWARSGPLAQVFLQVDKASWGVNDPIFVLPTGFRPGSVTPGAGMNGSVNNDPRSWWIHTTRQIYAGGASTGSIWGSVTYLVDEQW